MGAQQSLVAKILARARQLPGNDDGATAIEYALIAGGISLAVMSTVFILGNTVSGLYSGVANADIWPG